MSGKPGYLLVSGDFVKTGGMDRANHALASYLVRQGRELHLAAYRVAPDLLEGGTTTFHKVKKPLNSYLLAHPVLSLAGRKLARTLGKRLRVVVNGGNCKWGDVNWLHHINLLDAPRTHGGLLRRVHRQLAYKLYVRDDRAALNVAKLIVTTCERNKSDLIRWLGTPEEKVKTVYYGTDPATFHPATPDERGALRAKFGWKEGEPVFAFVGALGDLRKGFDTLFRAWSDLCREPGWDGRLVVAGAGPALEGWKQRTAEAGLEGRVEFLGFRRDVPDIMKAADAHVLPSRYEGYSLVTQEALCCGIPAFVTCTAGIAERYPAELQELLIPDPEDATDLANRLRRWRAGREGTAGAVSAFSEALRSYTWDDMASRFLDVVEATG